jgi:protocatechuate 3,4-dioxygenase beta subunit
VLTAVLALAAGASGYSQTRASDPFRTIRGQVVSDDDAAIPLRRVKIVLAGVAAVATPAYTDGEGRFEIAVPQSANYTLTLTKAGFAPLEVAGAQLTAAAPRLRLVRGAAITGRVHDQYGDPILTTVHARRIADETGRPTPAVERFTESDDLGEYRIGSLPGGRYEIIVQPINQRLPVPGTAPSGGSPITVQLRAGQEEALVVRYDGLPLDPRGRVIGGAAGAVVENGGLVRGRVVGPDGRAIGGAFVMLTVGGMGAREETTDAEGRYEFKGLPAGRYRIAAAKSGTSFTMQNRNIEIEVSERQVLDSFHIQMLRPSAVAGSVLDEYGDPVEGLMVEVARGMRGGGRAILQTQGFINRPPPRTDDRGRFRISSVPPGDYYVIAGEAPRVVGDTATGPESSLRIYYPGTPAIADALTVGVVAGQDTFAVNIGYAPSAGTRVYGYAFDADGRPLTFPVTLMDSFRSGNPVMVRREALVRADGAFTFQNVPPGDYVVQGVLRPSPGRSSEFAVEHVSVGGPEVAPITLRTARGTAVRGRVILEGNTNNVTFDMFGVSVYPSDLDYAPIGLDLSGSGVGKEGTFELRAHGPMRVTPQATAAGWWMKSATIGAIDVADQPYTFAANGETPVDVVVVFSDGPAEVSGRVIDARGATPREWSVLMFPVDQSRWYLSSRYIKLARPGVRPPGDPRADAGGTFRIPPMPPGEYWIVAVDRFDVATEWQDPDVLRTLASAAERISLTDRQKAVRDLRLVERPRP